MNADALVDDYLHALLDDAAAGAVPAGSGPAQAAMPAHAPPAPPQAVTINENHREPTWDDLPDEALHETAAAAAHGATVQAAGAPPAAAMRASTTSAPAAGAARPMPADGAAGNDPAWAPPPAATPPQRRASERSTRWLRLRCGDQAYALELLKVQEVVLPVALLPLRGTAAAILGIMNLRGQVVPVMDLGLYLGASAASADAHTRIVVLEEHGDIMGLRVSAVDDVVNLNDSQIEPPDTARICRISNDLFRGVARLQQQPMILLDATQLLG